MRQLKLTRYWTRREYHAWYYRNKSRDGIYKSLPQDEQVRLCLAWTKAYMEWLRGI